VFKFIIFDWDGTLMDSTEIIARAIQDAARDYSLPIPTSEQAKYVIGLGLNDSMTHLFPSLDHIAHQGIIEKFRVHYLKREFDAPLYPGVRAMLSRLQSDGFTLAIATGKARRGLDRVLESTKLAQFFAATRCADEGFAKPHPDMIERLLSATGFDQAESVMIGDTTHDMELAKNAGIRAIAVSYGAHPLDALQRHKPVFVASTALELSSWIRRQAGVANTNE
jgi:phosphoglycolate phosphatase